MATPSKQEGVKGKAGRTSPTRAKPQAVVEDRIEESSDKRRGDPVMVCWVVDRPLNLSVILTKPH